MTRKKKVKKSPTGDKLVFETFRKPGLSTQDRLEAKYPSCFNGIVSVHRYRITFELVEESDALVGKRIQKLWHEGANHHHIAPLRDAAKAVGLELKTPFGSKFRGY